jgi:hypothetical protein
MTNKTKTVSESFSFKDWNFMVWLAKNKAAIKNIVLGMLTLLGLAQANFQPNTWQIIALGVGVSVMKLGIDALDYYIVENPQ